MTRYGGIISSYQETLAELDKITGTSPDFIHLFIYLFFNNLLPQIHTCSRVIFQNYANTLHYQATLRGLCICVLGFGLCSDVICLNILLSGPVSEIILFSQYCVFVLGCSNPTHFFMPTKDLKMRYCCTLKSSNNMFRSSVGTVKLTKKNPQNFHSNDFLKSFLVAHRNCAVERQWN